MVSYIKHHFFVRYRQFYSFAHLNQIALQWLTKEADIRVHGTLKEVVNDRFSLEKATLCKLPIVKYDTSYFEIKAVAWNGYIEVKGGRYSVTSNYIGKQVNIRIGLDGNLKIYYNDLIIAKHLLKNPTTVIQLTLITKNFGIKLLELKKDLFLYLRRFHRAIKFFVRKYGTGLFS